MRHHILLTTCCIGLFAQTGAWADFESPSEGSGEGLLMPNVRPWDASIRVFVGHNDNVPLAPDSTFFDVNGERESAYAGVSIDAAYRFLQTPEWTAGVAISMDRVMHQEGGTRTLSYDPPDWYNLTAAQPKLFARRHFQMANGMPASVGLAYDYRRESLKVHAGGLKSHALNLDATISPKPGLTLSASYTNGKDDFEVPFTGSMNRDGDRQAFGLGVAYSWDNGLRSVKVGYTRADNDADGDDFDYDGNALKARFETHLQGPFWLGLEISKDDRDYNGGWGRTEQEITRFGAQLLWVLDRNWVADAYFTKDQYDANAPEFEAEQTKFGVGITYRF